MQNWKLNCQDVERTSTDSKLAEGGFRETGNWPGFPEAEMTTHGKESKMVPVLPSCLPFLKGTGSMPNRELVTVPPLYGVSLQGARVKCQSSVDHLVLSHSSHPTQNFCHICGLKTMSRKLKRSIMMLCILGTIAFTLKLYKKKDHKKSNSSACWTCKFPQSVSASKYQRIKQWVRGSHFCTAEPQNLSIGKPWIWREPV